MELWSLQPRTYQPRVLAPEPPAVRRALPAVHRGQRHGQTEGAKRQGNARPVYEDGRGGEAKIMAQRITVDVSGSGPLKDNLRDLVEELGGRKHTRNHGPEIMQVLGDAAEMIADRARSNAASRGVPQRVQRAIFTFNDPQKYQPMRPAALVGVRTGARYLIRKTDRYRAGSARAPKDDSLFKEWFAGGSWVSRKERGERVGVRKIALVKSAGGRLIGESLSQMFEKGTSRGIKATRYFRDAVFAVRERALKQIRDGYKLYIESVGGR